MDYLNVMEQVNDGTLDLKVDVNHVSSVVQNTLPQEISKVSIPNPIP